MTISIVSPSMKVHEKPKSNKFLLSAKKLYLTYSKCPLELETIIQLLKEKLSSYILEEWVVVREFHENGDPHLHVYLKTLKKVIIKSPIFLDIKHDSLTWHGNYQTARKPNQVIEYMLKGIKSKTDLNLYYSPSMSNLIGDLGNYKNFYQSLIDLAKEGKVEEAMEFLEQNDPELYLKQGKKLEDRLISIYKDKVLKVQSAYDIGKYFISHDLYDKLISYLDKRQKGENPVLAIVGEARHW
jgi:hypothetical protein